MLLCIFQIAKKELVSAFKREDLGNWLKKPMEQDQFMVPEWLANFSAKSCAHEEPHEYPAPIYQNSNNKSYNLNEPLVSTPDIKERLNCMVDDTKTTAAPHLCSIGYNCSMQKRIGTDNFGFNISVE